MLRTGGWHSFWIRTEGRKDHIARVGSSEVIEKASKRYVFYFYTFLFSSRTVIFFFFMSRTKGKRTETLLYVSWTAEKQHSKRKKQLREKIQDVRTLLSCFGLEH